MLRRLVVRHGAQRIRPANGRIAVARASNFSSGARARASSSSDVDFGSKYTHFDPKPALDGKGKIPISPYDIAPLSCTAPESTRGHLIIHPYTQPRPQETWPPAIESISPFVQAVGQRSANGGELADWSVSFSEGNARSLRNKTNVYPAWNVHHPKVARPERGDPTEEEEFVIHIYTGNGVSASVGPYSAKTLPEDLSAKIQQAVASSPIPSARYPKGKEETHIYVCTHGSRDCRCGVVGQELKEELEQQVRKHQLRVLGHGSKDVQVFGISHVGGHKWAANALVYPHGDWYGNLRVTDAPLLLRSALGPSTSRHDLTDQRERLVHWPRWRGRIGLTKEKMQKVWDEWGGGTVETAVIAPAVRRRPAAAVREAVTATAAATAVPTTVSIPFRKHSGELVIAQGTVGENLKDIAKRAGIEEIEATCDGKCECATCHAYLASSTDSTTPPDLNTTPPATTLPPATDEESDMLDYAISRKPTSRLTCQVVLTKELQEWFAGGGGVVQLSRF